MRPEMSIWIATSVNLLLLVGLCWANEQGVISDHIIHRPRPKQEIRPRPGAPMHVANASNNFAFDLYHALPYTKNSIFSPLALSTVMSMLYLGARGATAEEMSEVLGFDYAGLKGEEAHYGFQQVQKYVTRRDAKNDLNYVKAILIQKGFEVLQEYKNKLKSFYSAGIENVDFVKDSAGVTEKINKWVSDVTKGKIPTFLEEPVEPSTRLFLMSAVYFKGYWQTRFEKSLTEYDRFYNDGKDMVLVPMMRMKANLPFIHDEENGYMAVDLPYRGNQTSMLILLPDNRTGLPMLEQAIDSDMLHKIVSKLNTSSVQVELPRFHIEADYDLPEVLKSLGLTSIFDESKADLSGITGKKDIFVNKVVHKAAIDVNEEGSEAVGAVGVGAVIRVGAGNTVYFEANHPFLFIIRDVRSGMIYFIGRVTRL